MDHQLCAVEAWVKVHQQILEFSTAWLIEEKDTSDDLSNGFYIP
ncbi:MAG: hypothetical protein V7K39_08490 [Nostoc sp.]